MLKSYFDRVFLLFCLTGAFVFSFCGCSEDEIEDDEIVEPTPEPTPDPVDEPAILTFQFLIRDNPELGETVYFSIDEEEKLIEGVALTWHAAEKPDRYVAFFTTPGEDRVWVDGVEQVSGETVNSFQESLIYEVENSEGKRVTYTVRLLSPQLHSTLPLLRIESSGEIRDKVNYVRAKLEIVGNGITEGLWNFSKEDIEIRLRGNSTMGLPKRPYRIKFPEKYSPLGLNHTQAKSWVLLANDCDKSLLRNAIAFSMSELLFANPSGLYDTQYTIPYTPSTTHVDLYMNGKYQGIYHFSDQTQRETGRIEVESLKEKDGNDPVKITGGYIMEVDIHAGTGDFTTFISSQDIKMTHKYPDDDDYDESQYQYIREHINHAEDLLYGVVAGDETENWKQYFDMATAIDFMLVNEFCGDPDAYTSIWMYKRRGCNKIFFGPVWDFDSAFDNDNRISNAVRRMMLEASFPNRNRDHWFVRFCEDPEFKVALRERWNEMKDPLKVLAYRILNEEPERMSSSLRANFTRWNIREQALDTANPAPSNYEEEIQRLKNYIDRRYEYLDGEFNKW